MLAGGTSAAAPFVTGIAALAQSLDNNLEGYRIAKIIKKRVIKNNAYPVKTQGRVNAYNVLEDIIQQQNKRSLAE